MSNDSYQSKPADIRICKKKLQSILKQHFLRIEQQGPPSPLPISRISIIPTQEKLKRDSFTICNHYSKYQQTNYHRHKSILTFSTIQGEKTEFNSLVGKSLGFFFSPFDQSNPQSSPNNQHALQNKSGNSPAPGDFINLRSIFGKLLHKLQVLNISRFSNVLYN